MRKGIRTWRTTCVIGMIVALALPTATPGPAIAAGATHSLALKVDGSLWTLVTTTSASSVRP